MCLRRTLALLLAAAVAAIVTVAAAAVASQLDSTRLNSNQYIQGPCTARACHQVDCRLSPTACTHRQPSFIYSIKY